MDRTPKEQFFEDCKAIGRVKMSLKEAERAASDDECIIANEAASEYVLIPYEWAERATFLGYKIYKVCAK